VRFDDTPFLNSSLDLNQRILLSKDVKKKISPYNAIQGLNSKKTSNFPFLFYNHSPIPKSPNNAVTTKLNFIFRLIFLPFPKKLTFILFQHRQHTYT
jgi:hypothetical protein